VSFEALVSSSEMALCVSAGAFMGCFWAGREAARTTPRGWGRFAAPHAWIACLAAAAASVGLGVYGLVLDASSVSSLITPAALAGTLWGVRKGEDSPAEPGRRRWRTDYVKLVSTLVAAHLFLLGCYKAGVLLDGMPTLRQAVLDPSNFMGLAFHAALFGLGQLSTALAFRSLARAFAEDWTGSEDGDLSRARHFRLTALPLVICLIPSLLAQALLLGVLYNLARLLQRWCQKKSIAPEVSVLERLVRCVRRVVSIGRSRLTRARSSAAPKLGRHGLRGRFPSVGIDSR
jgi:hypothetical protein